MTTRTKYDFERLDKYCKKNGVTLVEDYSNDFITKNSFIKGKCLYENCENEFEKRFENLVKAGSYCKICIKIISTERVKETISKKYGGENNENKKKLEILRKNNIHKINLKKLLCYCDEHNIELLEDYTNGYLVNKSFIKGKCVYENCENEFEKNFRELVNAGGYCKSCIKIIACERRKQFCLEKYGCENASQSKIVQEKAKKTCLEKYGVEHTFQSESVKSKIKSVCLEKYGFENATQNKNIKNKCKLTCLEKYGVEYASQLKENRDKFKVTCLEKYGVENPTQNEEILEKSIKASYRTKDYAMPSGNVINYQGYENIALDELIINEKIDESDIITGAKNVPNIWYYDEDGKQRRHFVDIFIPSQNRCIEVKSTWTFTKPNVLCKQKAAKELGYKYEIWIYDKKGNKICYD